LKHLRHLALVAGLLFSSLVHADFHAGVEAIGRRDYAEAFKIFKPLAEKGNVAAQVNLGNLYMKGLGVEQSYLLSLRWYQKAADQGERLAQNKVGIQYFYGLGVAKDPATAAIWFEKSAQQGDTSAQTILGSLYASGEGVTQDLAKAYYWYTMAEEQGDKEGAKGRQSLEEEIKPGQKDEAIRMMAETRKARAEQEEKAFETATAGLGNPPEAKPEAAKESEKLKKQVKPEKPAKSEKAEKKPAQPNKQAKH